MNKKPAAAATAPAKSKATTPGLSSVAQRAKQPELSNAHTEFESEFAHFSRVTIENTESDSIDLGTITTEDGEPLRMYIGSKDDKSIDFTKPEAAGIPNPVMTIPVKTLVLALTNPNFRAVFLGRRERGAFVVRPDPTSIAA